MSLRPPGGAPPPANVDVDGRTVDLAGLAVEVCKRYDREFPDERDRYGDAGAAWCRHDNQWLLSWTVDDVRGATDLCEQVAWLAGVLGARDFPLDRLSRNLEIAGEVVTERDVFGAASAAAATRLRAAAATLIPAVSDDATTPDA